ncbi:NACHT domain-containing protein [Nostoc sp. KVJ3]|uniref:NACHT domain-containing protein n=1 Tax=Nostoc sp. KVJ3 TaxID=457945 RepID=UPI0022388171|nr:NACHT domain-containing protein [Nostoc sp. KVJ3]MCW5318488.1 NACHT domain-containing protein [Nostoc sp. KVJ3]
MGRSRNLILTNWTQANNSLFKHFEGNKSKLAKHARISRTTVTNFFNNKPVSESKFRKICLALRLNWEDVSSKIEESTSQPINDTDALIQQVREGLNREDVFKIGETVNQQENAFDTLIQQVRERCRQKILNHHSRMRLLNGDAIGVDQLYVDVWLLDRPEHKLYKTPKNLLTVFDIQNDRLALAKRLGDRNLGFDVADKNAKLVIFGKPGAGKTTFLKHLAVNWCKGKFQQDLIAVLIEFRQIQDGQWGLMYAIDQELGLENWNLIHNIKRQISELKQKDSELEERLRKERLKKEEIQALEQQLEPLPLQVLLKQGKLLVLMDGFDEVPTSELRGMVQSQFSQIVEDYPNNRFIMTCRTQIMESIPICFTSVEVAEFNEKQVNKFVHNWFMAGGKSDTEAKQQCEIFDNVVHINPAMRELTFTPVLLSLMCLILQHNGEMPSQVDWLYDKAISLLLSKWNKDKNIKDWEIGTKRYLSLNSDDKEKLLIEIASRKFENPENFVLFEQKEITKYIAEFFEAKANKTKFQKLANLTEALGVLKAIEAQHGLLIERADELWSFSHLTFQGVQPGYLQFGTRCKQMLQKPILRFTNLPKNGIKTFKFLHTKINSSRDSVS